MVGPPKHKPDNHQAKHYNAKIGDHLPRFYVTNNTPKDMLSFFVGKWVGYRLSSYKLSSIDHVGDDNMLW